jgi:predicted RNA-binding protein with PUA-like domain
VAHWLVKQEPSTYSFSRLVRDGRTRWDGVHNALALRHLRRMSVGDEAFFYHSGAEKACVGILRVVSAPRPDPTDTRGSWYVDVSPVRALGRSVPIREIRSDPAFAGFDLLRNSRLSVLPVPDSMWDRVLALAASGPAPAATAGTRGRARRPAPPWRGGGARRTR